MKTILTLLSAFIVNVAIAQTKNVVNNPVKSNITSKKSVRSVLKDSADVYQLNTAQAALIFQTLNGYKKVAATSLDVSAREVNLRVLPQIDSCQKILYNQMLQFEKARQEKAKSDTPNKIKPK